MVDNQKEINKNISRYIKDDYKFSDKLGHKYKNLGDEVYEIVKTKKNKTFTIIWQSFDTKMKRRRHSRIFLHILAHKC